MLQKETAAETRSKASSLVLISPHDKPYIAKSHSSSPVTHSDLQF